MKQYFLFCGSTYYPNGGYKDYVLPFETVKEAIDYAFKWAKTLKSPNEGIVKSKGDTWDWYHVADFQTGEILSEGKIE